jgi:hypothetical protein
MILSPLKHINFRVRDVVMLESEHLLVELGHL